MANSNSEKNVENQSNTKEKLKRFAKHSKEGLKKFGGRTKAELKKVGKLLASGYTLPMDKLIRYAALLTIIFGILAYFFHNALLAKVFPSVWRTNIWLLIFPMVGGILYFLFVKGPLEQNIFDKKTHIFLILSTGLACAAYFWPGIPLFILFIEICVASDAPFWNVLTESQTNSQTKSQTKPRA